MEKQKIIVFTGGHHNSALDLAKKLKSGGYKIIWYGHRHASKNNKNVSQEYTDVVAAEIPFKNLNSGKIHLGSPWDYLKVIRASIDCFIDFIKLKPDLVISFGGYLAFPPVLAAWFLKIPSISHEQTTVLGRANKAILPLVKTMYLSWPIKSLKLNPKFKIVGLPSKKRKIHFKNIVDLNNELAGVDPDMIFKNPNKPLLLICGGKQGSHFINCLFDKIKEEILKDWNVVIQTGDNAQTKDYYKLLKKRESLDSELKYSYVIISYSHFFYDILKLSQLVIGRSGAHTVWDVLNAEKKMIAIPLPFSYGNEQEENAQLLVRVGLGEILSQEKANGETLKTLIILMKDRQIRQDKIDLFKQEFFKNGLIQMEEDIKKMLD